MLIELFLVYGEELLKYDFGPQHPLTSARLALFWRILKGSGMLERESIFLTEPEMAIEEDVLFFHSKDYVDFVKKASERGYGLLDYGDTPAFKGVYEAAGYVAGSTLKVLDAIASNSAEHAFNPMGGLHHARRDSAGGFCVFNDPGIAVAKALEKGIGKILYVDIDAHHGDGVLYGFYEDPRVFIVDVHEDGRFLYPGTGFRYEEGAGEAKGTKVNIPLLPGSGDEELLSALEGARSFMEHSEAELILLQCGADGLETDPLTHLKYSLDGHRRAIELIHGVAHDICGGKLLALGGGGYDEEATARAWLGLVDELSKP